MKNIKVNYTDYEGKRTSTTINWHLCWRYFKNTEIYKNKEGGKDSIRQEVQKFVNEISVSNGRINQDLIEDLLFIEILDVAYERGFKHGMSHKK